MVPNLLLLPNFQVYNTLCACINLQLILIGTKTPSLVVKIENNTAQNIYYGKKYQVTPVWGDDGTLLSSSTITLVSQAAKKSLIGGIFTKGVLICDLL